MKLHRTISTFIHSLAIAALLTHVLMMSVAKASSVRDGSMPVCTSAGVQWLGSDGAPREPSKLKTPHCAWCSSGSWAAALPAPPVVVAAPPAGTVATTACHAEPAQRPQAAYTRPPSHAPPVLN
jgi:hypothetical protein